MFQRWPIFILFRPFTMRVQNKRTPFWWVLQGWLGQRPWENEGATTTWQSHQLSFDEPKERPQCWQTFPATLIVSQTVILLHWTVGSSHQHIYSQFSCLFPSNLKSNQIEFLKSSVEIIESSRNEEEIKMKFINSLLFEGKILVPWERVYIGWDR